MKKISGISPNDIIIRKDLNEKHECIFTADTLLAWCRLPSQLQFSPFVSMNPEFPTHALPSSWETH